MTHRKFIVAIVAATTVSLATAGCSSSGSNKGATGQVGSLTVAYPTQPDTLDPYVTTANATRDAARLIYESLLTLDKNFRPIPQLAKSFDVSSDKKEIDFKLRKHVNFHNGQEMTADDVVASMKAWQKQNSLAKSTLVGPKWVKTGKFSVELRLKEPSSIATYVLADQSQLAAIMPKSVVAHETPTGVKKYVGTGPFKFGDWKHGQSITFHRFKKYSARKEPANGLGGKKEALVDTINWDFVGDTSTRVTGLLSGQYDFSHMLDYDSVDKVKANPQMHVEVWPYGLEILVFNKKQGLFTSVKARQAVNLAIDKKGILQSAFTDPKYYDLDGGLFLPRQKSWYSTAGEDLYKAHNVAKAKKLLSASGYHGQTIHILTSKDYSHHYNAAVATQQDLREIGMKVKLDVYDWPTLLERRAKPGKWDIFYTGWPTMSIPQQYTFFSSKAAWPGWTNNPTFDKLLKEIGAATSQKKARSLTADLQAEMWKSLPIVNVGTDSRVSAYSKNVTGYTELLGPIFWNVSVKN